MEIEVDKPTIGIGIYEFQERGLTCLNMASTLLGMMVPSEE